MYPFKSKWKIKKPEGCKEHGVTWIAGDPNMLYCSLPALSSKQWVHHPLAYAIVDSINVVRPEMLSNQEPERSGLNIDIIAHIGYFVNSDKHILCELSVNIFLIVGFGASLSQSGSLSH